MGAILEQRRQNRQKAIKLLTEGMHPSDIANREVPFDLTTIYRIAREEGIQFVKKSAGRKTSPEHLRKAAAAVKGGIPVYKAAEKYGVCYRKLGSYMKSQMVEKKPVESSEFEALRAYYRRHAANLTWFQSSQF